MRRSGCIVDWPVNILVRMLRNNNYIFFSRNWYVILMIISSVVLRQLRFQRAAAYYWLDMMILTAMCGIQLKEIDQVF